MRSATIYVDANLASGDCAGTYDPSSRTCGGGSSFGYASVDAGLDAATPGDTVLLREGAYGQIAPSSSGTQGSPITIAAHTGERAVVENISRVAIVMDFLAHIVVDGLEFRNVQGFGNEALVDVETTIELARRFFDEKQMWPMISLPSYPLKYLRKTLSLCECRVRE